MSNFPPIPGNNPQGLNQALFDECYNVLAEKIRDETSMEHDDHFRPVRGPLWQRYVNEAMAGLSYWQSYAIDGDVSMVSGDGPWMILSDNGDRLIPAARSVMENAAVDMHDVWRGQGYNGAEGYITTTKNLLDGYCPTTSGDKSGIVNQAATVLQGAYATAVAFKQDLHNLAKHASDALDKLDHGAGDPVPVWLVVAAVGIALTGAGGAVAVSGEAVTAAFTGGLLSGLGGLVINQATPQGSGKYGSQTNPEYVGGRDPQEIMYSLAKATDVAVNRYKQAASASSLALKSVWDNIYGLQRNAMLRPQPAPSPNVSIDTSLQISRFFPEG